MIPIRMMLRFIAHMRTSGVSGGAERDVHWTPWGAPGMGALSMGGQVPGRKDRKALGRLRRNLHAGMALPDGAGIVLPDMPMIPSSW